MILVDVGGMMLHLYWQSVFGCALASRPASDLLRGNLRQRTKSRKKKNRTVFKFGGFWKRYSYRQTSFSKISFRSSGKKEAGTNACSFGGFKLMWGSKYWGFEAHTSRPKTEEIEVGKPSVWPLTWWMHLLISSQDKSAQAKSSVFLHYNCQRLSRDQVHQKKMMWVEDTGNCVYKARRKLKSNPTKKWGWNEGGK